MEHTMGLTSESSHPGGASGRVGEGEGNSAAAEAASGALEGLVVAGEVIDEHLWRGGLPVKGKCVDEIVIYLLVHVYHGLSQHTRHYVGVRCVQPCVIPERCQRIA